MVVNMSLKKFSFQKVRVGDLVFSKASESSKNAGGIYVFEYRFTNKSEKVYIGKVLGGYYLPYNSPSAETIKLIQEVCKKVLLSLLLLMEEELATVQVCKQGSNKAR